MFFLRCAFWLSVVYSSMTWPNGSFQAADLGSAVEAGRVVTASVLDHAVAGAGELCRREPAKCLADAERLSALLRASAVSDTPDTTPTATTVAQADVPLPVPDPRRVARGAKVPHTP